MDDDQWAAAVSATFLPGGGGNIFRRGFTWVKALLSGGSGFHLMETIYSTAAEEMLARGSLVRGPLALKP